jgi:ubiquinone/menaquinone biosynthesis C-methylase UbiE
MLHKVYPGVSLSGVDPSADMIEFARKQLPDTIGLTVAYAQATGLPSEKYDWIVSILALHHIPPQEKTAAIRELSRILRPNGQVLIVDFGRPVNFLGGLGSFLYLFHSYTKDNMVDVKRLLLTEGFSIRPSGHQYGFIEHLFAQKAGNPVSKPPEGIF